MKNKKRKQPKKDGWYVSKNYPHFDLPISFAGAKRYVLNPAKIANHDFYPFLAYEIVTRRYKGKEKGASNKERPIKYASHLDGNIYSYYGLKLGKLNEARILAHGLNECVIGYRAGLGSNIHLARKAIKEIQVRKECVAIALDISDFYGHIDHNNLEVEWQKTLNEPKLPKDHLAIFRSLTKWTCVDRDKLAKRLSLPSKLPLRLIDSPSILRTIRKEDKNRTPEEKIFQTNPHNYGIPQGSPMSSLLSNIYMLPFDIRMSAFAEKIGGFYRRYSDDILFICDKKLLQNVLSEIDAGLAERGKELKRNKDKDHISHFSWDTKKQTQTCDKEFQYLGFTFDGKNIRIRSQTLSKYHRRIKFATRSAKKAALAAVKKGGSAKVFKKGLNRTLTHLGKQGFAGGYAKNSQDLMADKAIKSQIKGSYERVEKETNTPLKKRKR